MSAAPRVLIVEDSATQAAALDVLLEGEGYVTILARRAEQALELLASTPVDLILSDVVMPGMDGYELCRRIKATPAWEEIPVVLLTSLVDPLAIVRGLASGADHYVTKPYQPEWLLARLRTVLARAGEPRLIHPSPISLDLLGTSFTIRATKEQILELLVSSYSDLVRTSEAVRDAERRARFLADAGELLSSSLDAQQVLRDLAHLAVPRIAELCAVDLLDTSGTPRRVKVVHALEAAAAEDPAIAAAPPSEVLLRAVAERSVQTVSPATRADLQELARDPELVASLEGAGPFALLVVPLVARDRVLGVMQFLVGVSSAGLQGDDRLFFLEDLARRAALAVDNALLYGEAQRATRARDDVLAIVSHDLRNPLNTIHMSTGFMLDMFETPGAEVPVVPQLQVIQRATKRANALIQDLLDVSRIDAGTLAVAAYPTSAEQLLRESALELAPLATPKRLVIEHEWSGPDVHVAADRSRIGQVFSNLVGNAVKFTPPEGSIRLLGRARDDVVEYEVVDTGSGIAAEHLPHLFDRFWQATQTSRTGAGLGLFIVKGIVDAHHGTIEVSGAEGGGTRFRFTIPRSATGAQRAAEDAE